MTSKLKTLISDATVSITQNRHASSVLSSKPVMTSFKTALRKFRVKRNAVASTKSKTALACAW